MRLLVFRWACFTQFDVEETLTKMGIDFDTFDTPINRHLYRDEEFIEKVVRIIRSKAYDAVFSVNYVSSLSEACHQCDVTYIAWSYDSPLNIGYIHILKYPTTHVFSFDREECKRVKRSYDTNNIHHLPLAVNVERFDSYQLSSSDWERYRADISFVGQLYDNIFEEVISVLPDFYKAYFNAMNDVQLKTYGIDTIFDGLSTDILKEISTKEFKDSLSELYLKEGSKETEENEISPGILRYLMEQYVTHRERITLLEFLGRHYNVHFYSYQDNQILQNVEKCGALAWDSEMPKSFKGAKINLNISLRTIISGIPQRCLDIMAAGGFLLSNYQEELDEMIPRDACEMYSSIEEAYDKAGYYLQHDEERKRIAAKGREVMLRDFTYEDRLRRILETAGLGSKLDK